ncbi:Ubiquinol oxidase 2, mitochondrial [Capsicum chinense]|nr:Ubiquinol oxidase 2, mitochondrial [Capsicum chinense]
MSTSEFHSSGKRKAYREVTTKRLCKSFKENNYPDCDAKEKFEQSGGCIHRVVGHLEEEAIHSYTLYLNNIDRGEIENVLARTIEINYCRLPKDATLKDVDEAYHRDVNHFVSP